MPTAILQSQLVDTKGNARIRETSKNITHNNARLYHEGGRTYEYVGNDRSGNRMYRDTSKQQESSRGR